MNDKQIKKMVDRFLQWKLPEDFHPDAGISFKSTYNEHTKHPARYEPIGTNLFTATQAEQMIRYMLEGLSHRQADEAVKDATGTPASMTNQSNKALRDEIDEVVLDCINTAFNGGILNPIGHDFKDTCVDSILALVTNHIKGALPEKLERPPLYTETVSYMKAVELQNATIDEVHQLLEEVSNEK